MGLKSKTSIFIFLILFFPSIAIGFFSYSEAKKGLVFLAKQQMDTQIKNVVDRIRSKLEFVIRENPEIITNDNVLSGMIEDELVRYGITKNSYIFILNKEGRVILHPKREKKIRRENFLNSNYKELKKLAERMLKDDYGFEFFKDEDGNMYASFMKYKMGDVIAGSSIIQAKYDLGWSIAIVYPETEILTAAKRILYIFLLIFGVSLIFATIIGFILINMVILRNIDTLVYGMNSLAENEDIQIKIASKDELGYLAESFNKMVVELKESRIKLIQQENLKKEIELAARIQTCLLPHITDCKYYDISAKMLPAENVGGDYYDFLSVTEDRIWLGIGDVSGHGLTSGLIMMMAQTAFNTVLLSYPNITSRDLIIQTNRVLYNNVKLRMKEDHFMTLSFLSADKEGNVSVAGAHLDIFVYRKNINQVEKIPTRGIWLGILPEIEDKIDENSFKLESGDVMILYTDGIIEAMDKDRNLYEPYRLIGLLKKFGALNSKEIRDEILKDVLSYMESQYDDITLVVVKKI
mgnify:CR=1 FL=1